jgi:hypothetical protein
MPIFGAECCAMADRDSSPQWLAIDLENTRQKISEDQAALDNKATAENWMSKKRAEQCANLIARGCGSFGNRVYAKVRKTRSLSDLKKGRGEVLGLLESFELKLIDTVPSDLRRVHPAFLPNPAFVPLPLASPHASTRPESCTGEGVADIIGAMPGHIASPREWSGLALEVRNRLASARAAIEAKFDSLERSIDGNLSQRRRPVSQAYQNAIKTRYPNGIPADLQTQIVEAELWAFMEGGTRARNNGGAHIKQVNMARRRLGGKWAP